ncbi:MmgE/PrpD family protein [Acetonema longum]|uniref:MmgE/PrpD family protein n=1 Tax=Acetonema longum DSM 6540 TaxID=1009370 RepID=F7NP74_9FIRM|nr:MmgE/PrpD family protein [Acetonema longum]EGO62197.1 MmgE/PrpD family protein [Acetonema longum DSM 6540]
MNTLTGILAQYIHKTTFTDLPEPVVTQAKQCLIDTIGCSLAGVHFPEIVGATKELTAVDTQTDCVIWGMSEKASLLTAALLNGVTSHAVEMDDVHKTSKTHTGAVVIPAAVTLAGYRQASGKELLTAIVMGYESAYRIGTGINASAHRLQGWHATGVCCTFGSAAAAGKLLHLDEAQTVSALGMAGTQSSGLWALTMDGATCKKLYMGKAAQSGILSALLAQGGMTGPAYVLEAEDGGLFRAASSNYRFEAVTEKLGERWDILKADRKPYACCRSAQPPIDAILHMRREYGIRPEDVASIRVNTYDIAVKQCFNTKRPKNVVEAQLCIPYTVAVALTDGAASPRQFTGERIADDALMALAAKVDVFEDSAFTGRYPQNWGCQLILKTVDGKEYEQTIVNAKGDSDNPLSFDDLVGKFTTLADGVLPAERQKRIIDCIMNLEKQETVANLVGLLEK